MADAKIGVTFLLSGQDLPLTPAVSVKHPKLKDIWTLGNGLYCEEVYWTYVMTLLSDPYDAMVWLDDRGIDYEEVTSFDVFLLRWVEAKKAPVLSDIEGAADEIFRQALSFFCGSHDFDIAQDPSGIPYIYAKDSTEIVFVKESFDWLSAFLTEMHCIQRTDKIKPATKGAKAVLIEDKRDEERRARRKQKEWSPLHTIGDAVSTLLFGGSGYSPVSIGDAPIYTLLCGASVKTKQMRVQAMLNGVYTGMLKPDGISPSAFNWASIAP